MVRSPKAALLLGAAWTVGGRWSIKALGFVSTVVMARLLVPEDYGVVAMAMLAVGLVQALLDFSAHIALLRKSEVTRVEIDSAWTLGLLQGLATGFILAAASPLLAIYFKEPRVMPVLLVLALCIPLASAGNIGLTLAHREFQFAVIFRHQVVSKLIGIGVTIAGGWWLGDYRALVIGSAAGYLSSLVLSYTMHPYRPHWDTAGIRDIWQLTKWLLLGGIAQFCLRRSDELIAARIGGAHDYGLYNVGSDLGQMPVGEVGPALLRALLPVLASLKDDVKRVNDAMVKVVAAVNTITIALAAGVAVLAVPFTTLLLGPKWIDAAPYVAVFALVASIQMVASPLNALLVLRGFTREGNRITWIEFAVFIAFACVLLPWLGLIGLAWARVGAGLCALGVCFWIVRRYCALAPSRVLSALARPMVGAALMSVCVSNASAVAEGIALKLFVGISCGAAFYLVWTFSTWLWVGRPEGFESTLLDLLARRRASPVARDPDLGDG